MNASLSLSPRVQLYEAKDLIGPLSVDEGGSASREEVRDSAVSPPPH